MKECYEPLSLEEFMAPQISKAEAVKISNKAKEKLNLASKPLLINSGRLEWTI